MQKDRKSVSQNKDSNGINPNLKIVDKNSQNKYKVRPQWTEPIVDQDGNTKGWRVMPNLLAKTIVDDNLIFSAVDQRGKSTVYYYNNIYWEPIDISGIRNIVAEYFQDNEYKKTFDLLTSRILNDTANLVMALAPRKKYSDTFDANDDTNLNYIPFDYYDYNIITNQNVDHSPDRYFTYKRDYDLQEGTADLTNNWLLESLGGDEEQLKLMKIFIGSSFYRSYKPLQFMIFIIGEGGDGKSEFLDFWGSKLIGSETNSHLSFDQIVRTGSNFALAELYHKELNTYDDLNASYIDSSMMGTAKQLTGGNPFDSEVKNKGNLRFANYAKLVFAANDMPEIQDLGPAEKRRIYIFKWHKIDNFEKKYGMLNLIKERGAFVKQCIDAFSIIKLERDVGKSQREVLPMSEAIEDNWKQFQIDSDPVARFIAARCESDTDYTKDRGWIVGKRTLYNDFIKWTKKHNLRSQDLGDKKFSKRVKKLGFKDAVRKIDGKSTRIWKNIMLLPEDVDQDTESSKELPEINY